MLGGLLCFGYGLRCGVLRRLWLRLQALGVCALSRSFDLLAEVAHRHVLPLNPLDAEREPPPLLVDLEDLHVECGVRLDHLARALDVVVGELGDVDQTLDPGQDLDEGAEGDDLGHGSLEHVAGAVGADHPLPRVLLRLLETERDALAIAVDVEHFDPHRVADRDDLGGMVDVAPGKLGDVDQAVDPVEVDEGAEVDDVGDLALDHLAGLEATEDLLADLLALFLEHGAPREHHVVAAAVQLDHFALERLAEELVEVVDATDVDQRGRQEATHPEIEDEAALDDLDHVAFDRFAGLGSSLDAAPRLLEAGSLLGEDQAALGVLFGEDEGIDLLAQVDLVGGIHGLADRELGRGDDPLRLVADIDQDLVLVDPHDIAFDDVALVEGDHRRGIVRHDLAVDFDEQAVGSLDGRAGRSRGQGRIGHGHSGE